MKQRIFTSTTRVSANDGGMKISFSFTCYVHTMVVYLKWISIRRVAIIEHVKRTFYTISLGVSGVSPYIFRRLLVSFPQRVEPIEPGLSVCPTDVPTYISNTDTSSTFVWFARTRKRRRALGPRNRTRKSSRRDVLVPWEVFETYSYACRCVTRREVVSIY